MGSLPTFPGPSTGVLRRLGMDEDKIEALGWRWEFMRRNPDYRNDYQKVKELRGNAKNPPGSMKKKTVKFGKERAGIETDLYHDTPEYGEEQKICSKWGVSIMIDPDIAFLEILKGQNNSPATKVVNWATAIWILHGLEQHAVFVTGDFQDPDDKVQATEEAGDLGLQAMETGYSRLHIDIDFTKVNSLSDLKSTVCSQLEIHFSKFAAKRRRSGKQSYMIDYDLILRVGDMKVKDGLTNQDIAKKICARKFNENPESATRTVGYLWKRYKDIVNGGYRKITYP